MKAYYFLFFNLVVCLAAPQGPRHNPKKKPATVPPPDYQATDISEELSNQALNVYVHPYENINFEYANNQDPWVTPRPKGLIFRQNCYRQYLKCIMDQTYSEPVCAFNAPFYIYDGYASFPNLCDMFFNNCRRGYRVFRALDSGLCDFEKNSMIDSVLKDPGYRGAQGSQSKAFIDG